MHPMIVVLFAMEFVSLMLTVILVTAWNSFGRPRHALIWCGAFVVAAVGWAVNILLVSAGPDERWLRFLLHMLAMGTWALMLIGFRVRAGLRTPGWMAVPGAGVPLAALAFATLAGHYGLSGAIPPLFAAAMLSLSALTMLRRGSRNQAESAVIAMLLAFAMLDAIAGIMALRQEVPGGGGQYMLSNALMVLTAPSAFIGTGLFAVFLLAVDLAERMGKLAASDPLTGVLNRRGFEEAGARAIALARRQGQPLTIVMADLDRFKSINDRYGHAAGDMVLRRFTEHVGGSIRAGDLFGRIGGEEFALLLVDASPSDALDAIDRIRMALGELQIAVGASIIQMTASFGITGPSDPDEQLPAILARADSALYRSKMAGRDGVTMAPRPPTIPPRLQALATAAEAALALNEKAAR